MQFVCDAPRGLTWFSIETQVEADAESELMGHKVGKYFKLSREAAQRSYRPRDGLASIERDIGLEDHIRRRAPLYLTLRDGEGEGLVTAMLTRDLLAGGQGDAIIVGPNNSDPYPAHQDAVSALEAHFGILLPKEDCFPYA